MDSSLSKTLKYQGIIDGLKLTNCPNYSKTSIVQKEIKSYRWTLDPITHDRNFLPNVKYDELRGHPLRRNSSNDDLCGRCSLSFFSTKKAAIDLFNSIPLNIRNKLGYTHVAEGNICKDDGYISDVDEKSHFMLFELEHVNLVDRFYNIDTL